MASLDHVTTSRMDLPAQFSGSNGWRGPWAVSLGVQFPFRAVPQICAVTLYPAVMPSNNRDNIYDNNTNLYDKETTKTITRGETYTLSSWERDFTELLEEKDACHRWDQIHDEVVVHHTPRIQLQTFEVVRGEMGCQLWATESCEGQRRVSSGL